jgi:hypothetical protein
MSVYPILQHESGPHAQQNPNFICFDGSTKVSHAYTESELRHVASEMYREMYRQAPEHYPQMKDMKQIPGAMGVHSALVPGQTERETTATNYVSIHSSLRSKPKVKLGTTGPTSSAAGFDMNKQSSRRQTRYTPVSVHSRLDQQLRGESGARPRHAYDYKCAEVGLFSNNYYKHGDDAPPGQFYVVGPNAEYLAPCGVDDRYGCRDIGEAIGAIDIGVGPRNQALGEQTFNPENPSNDAVESNVSLFIKNGSTDQEWTSNVGR